MYNPDKSTIFAKYSDNMRKYITIYIATLMAAAGLSSCGQYNKIMKSNDSDIQYEAAKTYYGRGKYSKAANLLEGLIMVMKGTDKAEESIYLLAMTYYNQGDYVTASRYFNTCYTTYPRGEYTEEARFHSGKALCLDTPEPKLDQSSTYAAIQELQLFLEYFPQSRHKTEAQDMIYQLQDKLVEKEYLSAKLYYDLGTYTGNASYTTTGNNYQACVVTARNALRDYPYCKRREDLTMLVLKARYDMARQSVIEKKPARMREALDEYYAFINEYPDSKYRREADKIYRETSKYVDSLKED